MTYYPLHANLKDLHGRADDGVSQNNQRLQTVDLAEVG
jgi:hypothetical protein